LILTLPGPERFSDFTRSFAYFCIFAAPALAQHLSGASRSLQQKKTWRWK
jgi:hypothetical protein